MTPKFISRSDPAVQAPQNPAGFALRSSATRRNSGIRGGLSPAEEVEMLLHISSGYSAARVSASGVQKETTTNFSSRLLPKT